MIWIAPQHPLDAGVLDVRERHLPVIGEVPGVSEDPYAAGVPWAVVELGHCEDHK